MLVAKGPNETHIQNRKCVHQEAKRHEMPIQFPEDGLEFIGGIFRRWGALLLVNTIVDIFEVDAFCLQFIVVHGVSHHGLFLLKGTMQRDEMEYPGS